MKKIVDGILRFWYFHIANPVLKRGEKGGFKWVFRKFFLEIRTVSGNWKMRVVAGEHPYGYLLEGLKQGNEDNVHGFAATVYSLSMMLTRDQGFVDDVHKAMRKYEARALKAESKKEREDDDIALKEVEMTYEYIGGKKVARGKDGRFKKVS